MHAYLLWSAHSLGQVIRWLPQTRPVAVSFEVQARPAAVHKRPSAAPANAVRVQSDANRELRRATYAAGPDRPTQLPATGAMAPSKRLVTPARVTRKEKPPKSSQWRLVAVPAQRWPGDSTNPVTAWRACPVFLGGNSGQTVVDWLAEIAARWPAALCELEARTHWLGPRSPALPRGGNSTSSGIPLPVATRCGSRLGTSHE